MVADSVGTLNSTEPNQNTPGLQRLLSNGWYNVTGHKMGWESERSEDNDNFWGEE